MGPRFDTAALQEIDQRWRALGIPALRRSAVPAVVVRHAGLAPQAYRLTVTAAGVRIAAGDADGAFYAAMTLAQLPVRDGSDYVLPCVSVSDAPALRWRILADDVSRGPLPTMRYFEERIRTIAAFKMNGYSPMMEHVFVDPRHPLPAPLDGITPAQLHALDRYAAQFHVTFIPQQQTLAHMHHTLALERYAGAAATPHGFLMEPLSPMTQRYLRDVLNDELAAVPHPRFFHIMSDEAGVSAAVFEAHLAAMHAILARSGARMMVWDDAIQQHPSIGAYLPPGTVVVDWHYGSEPSYRTYIDTVARTGAAQMVDPGDDNWNRIFPNLRTAIPRERRFIDEAKQARVLGLFMSTWNDDGETLFESTWYPVLYAAADAWEQRSVDPVRFARDFPSAFFGSDDPRYARDVARLSDAEYLIAGHEYFGSDAYFWADPFDPKAYAALSDATLHTVRLEAEDVEADLLQRRPPLHANAAFVMELAARRYDLLGRQFQAGREIADFLAHPTARNLLWAKYWCWELRDREEEIAPLYAQAWRYEDRPSHLGSNLALFTFAEQRAVARAAAIERLQGEP